MSLATSKQISATPAPPPVAIDQAAAVVAGEGRRRAAREIQMKLRCISQHKSNGAGDYLCWFSSEGRIDYFGETRGGRAHGWGLAEYQDGSWCLR